MVRTLQRQNKFTKNGKKSRKWQSQGDRKLENGREMEDGKQGGREAEKKKVEEGKYR